MKTWGLFLALGFILAVTPAEAAPAKLPTFLELIKGNRAVAVSDGSSFFIFFSDGLFLQEPVGLSGRCVSGKWTADVSGEQFTILGNWSWENGITSGPDPRRMVIVIYPVSPEPKFETANYMGTSFKVCRCYFEIEELTKISPGSKGNTAGH